MSPRVAVAVLLLGLAASAIGAELPRLSGDAPTLPLVWYDPTGVAWGTELVARAEATALLKRLGARASWRRGASGEVTRKEEVWVILVDAGPPQPTGALVLGAARAQQTIARVLWIRVPNVGAAVGVMPGRPLRILPPGPQRLVGVALGRVIVHEVVHALVPTLPHGAGLMSRSLTGRELASGNIQIEPEVTLAFRAALRGDPVLAPPGVAAFAASAQLQEKDR